MGAWEIILIVVCAVFLVAVLISLAVKKAKGKPVCDCGCDCAHCQGCYHCETYKKLNEQKKDSKTESAK